MMRFNNRLIVASFMTFAALIGGARDIYVATNGAGGGVPLFGAWTNASANIEWAVNAGTNGDTVWISNGVYVLTNQVTVNSNIAICGNPGELVVVDGNNANRCFNFPSTLNKGGALSNLFITRGYTNGNGGGIYMLYGAVRDCIFSNNVAVGASFYGGGMYFSTGTGTIRRCTFIANIASNGGGGGMYFSASTTLVDQCRFLTNSANYGGGLFAGGSNLTVTNCNFISNVSTNQGGGIYANAGPQIITHSTFASNVVVIEGTYGGGGGIYVSSASGFMSNCFISNNIAVRGGGGIYGGYAGGIKNCTIARNRVTTTVNWWDGGGGVQLTAGIMQDCIIEENNGYGGGGVLLYGGTLRNCLIRNNVSGGYAGGIQVINGTIGSCTIVSNYASNGGGVVGRHNSTGGFFDNCIVYSNKNAGGATYDNLRVGVDGAPFEFYTFTNCCFTPELADLGRRHATNTVTASPQFADWPAANYRLTRDSPCVNSGVNRDWMTFDIDGRQRIDIFGGITDIGCYEYVPSGTLYLVK